MVEAAERRTLTDDDLVVAFEKCDVDEWTHRMHVRAAYVYLKRHGLTEAIIRMRASLKAFAAAKGVEESHTSGYNETMTVAWMYIIHATMREQGAADDSEQFLEAQSHLANRRLLRLFYSRAIWDERDCKRLFVAPDLASLPLPRPEY